MSNEPVRKLVTWSLTVILTLAGVVTLLWLGIGPVPQVRAASPIYVRPDGHDTLCNGTTNDPYPGSGGPGLNCALKTIQSGVDLVDFGGTVNVAAGTYTENVAISRDLTLEGAGTTDTIMDGGGSDSVFYIGGGSTVTISGVTIRNGAASWGGGIYIGDSSTFTLTNSTVFSNTGTYGGGGISNWGGRLTIGNTAIISNTTTDDDGEGGGILHSGGTLTVIGSTIIGNTAGDLGGGIASWAGKLAISNSTVRRNQVSGTNGSGGGIFNAAIAVLSSVTVGENMSGSAGGGIHSQAPMTMTNVTVSGNAADYGGGVSNTVDPLTIVNSTIASNTVTTGSAGPGGIQNYGLITFTNTILAYNQNANCYNPLGDPLTSNGHNLDSGDTCGFSATGDITDTNPLLGPLQDNGGDTWTHALLKGSPAIDMGTNTGCPPTDQRGVSRPVDGDLDGTATCDIGAYEYELPLIHLPLVLRNFR
jgi:parallel beta-helix repeat protein